MNRKRIFAAIVALAITATAIAAEPPTVRPVVNINTATAAQLAYLPGVGDVIAARIVAYRAVAHGSFRTVGMLQDVKGIGSGKKYLGLRDYATLTGPTTVTEKIRAPKPTKR